MNEIIAKKATIFSLIFGALIGVVSLVPQFIGISLFVLSFLSAPIVILFMKKNKQHLAFINNQEGAVLGALIGFFSTIGFFITFCPLVCMASIIFKNYYSYAIPQTIQSALWLLFVIAFMVAVILAMTNSTSGMGVAWILSYIEEKPQDWDAQLDIKIED